MAKKDRLEELLDQKDEENESLREQIEVLQARLSHEFGNIFPECLPEKQTLPVPRLEMVWKPSAKHGWSNYSVVYRLVTRHYLGYCVGTVFGETRVSGNCDREPFWDNGHPQLPFRAGVHVHHDSLALNMPVFYVYPGRAPGRITWSAESDASVRSNATDAIREQEKKEGKATP